MGAPKVSNAICTMSIARTTPAQKPRGLSKRTRLEELSGRATADVFTKISIRCWQGLDYDSEPYTVHIGSLNRYLISCGRRALYLSKSGGTCLRSSVSG